MIDTCGFEPEHVGATAELLADHVGHYGFVSSGSAYRDWPDAPVTEDSPVFESDERSTARSRPRASARPRPRCPAASWPRARA